MGISSEDFNVMLGIVSWATCGDGRSRDTRAEEPRPSEAEPRPEGAAPQLDEAEPQPGEAEPQSGGAAARLVLPQHVRERVGRRAKQLLDWARVLHLRDRGFDARLCYFVPSAVSLENVCIIAKKLS